MSAEPQTSLPAAADEPRSAGGIAIEVVNLSKRYQIYAKPSDRLKQSIYPRLQQLVGREPSRHYKEFWALRDVSLQVRKGETVGIIGRNGSGKSTLLQVICGTLNPSEGEVRTHGRIAALLELGSGFSSDFTGRENVFVYGAILGLGAEEIAARFDAIAAFADIGQFIDQPLKTYSSGMVVRLAFAVAINVDPQILVVDEALSVGDELFQRKCYSRIEAIKDKGATILFVSHSGSTIVELCDRAVLLDAGERLAVGEPKKIVALYQRLIYAPAHRHDEIRREILLTGDVAEDKSPVAGASGEQGAATPQETADDFFDPHFQPQSSVEYTPRGARISDARIHSVDGRRVNCLRRGRTYLCRYRVDFQKDASRVRFGMLIKTNSGFALGGGTSAPASHKAIAHIAAGTTAAIEFRFTCNLNAGVYFMNAGVTGSHDEEEFFLHRILDVCVFRVLPEPDNVSTELVDFHCALRIQLEEPAQGAAGERAAS